MTEKKKKCNKCPATESSKWYKVLLLSLDENGEAVDVYEVTLCYTCRRAYGRFVRNEL